MMNREPGAALFQGQGAQVPGSYRGLYETNPTFRARIDRADQLCSPHGFTVRELWYGSRKPEIDGEAADTSKIQPALTAIECGIHAVLQSHGVEATKMLLGHSLGQIPAGEGAGAISFDTAIKLSIVRGQVMKNFNSVHESAVGLIRDAKRQYIDLSGQVKAYLEENRLEIPDTYLTILNHQYQLLIGGPLSEVGKALQGLKVKFPGIKVTNFKNATLSHTPYLQEGQDAYNDEMGTILRGEEIPDKKSEEKLRIPIVSDVLGDMMEAGSEFFESAKLQLIRQVDWSANLEFMSRSGVREGIEIGPKQLFAVMMAEVDPDILILPTHNEAAIEVVLARYGRARRNFAGSIQPK